ncbi:MAG: TolC family protein, partial [Campylobacter hyointestinalis]
MKNIIYIFIGLLFVGCASKNIDYKVKEVSFYTPTWYLDFNQTVLNRLIDTALKNNEDINIAVLSLRQAMLKAGVAKADFFPTPSANAKASTSRDISKDNDWKNGFSSDFSLSYELDIYGKIFDNFESLSWDAASSNLNLANLKLTIYINDAIRNLKQNLVNLNELDRLVITKYELGKEEILSVRQSKQNLLDLQNSLLTQQKNLQTSYEVLKNLTRSDISLDDLSLSGVELRDISLDIKFDTLKNRPDINEAISSLNAGFYSYKVAQKDLYPSINIGASLSDSDDKFSDSFGFNIIGGNLSIKLPFLDYARLSKQVKISEAEFEKRVLTYEKTLSNAT